LAMSIPSAMKTTNGSAKYILKKAVKGVVPDEIIARVKQPWDVPLFEWYFGTLGDKCRKEIMEFCEKTDFFDRGEIERYVARGFEGSGRRAWAWYLLNLAMWWKEFME
jgi:asparagine synthase (glutamine-hydrolysing)